MADFSLKSNINKNLIKTAIPAKQKETKSQEAVKSAEVKTSVKTAAKEVVSAITNGTVSVAKAVSVIKESEPVKVTKTKNLTTVTSKVENKPITIKTNGKVEDVPIKESSNKITTAKTVDTDLKTKTTAQKILSDLANGTVPASRVVSTLNKQSTIQATKNGKLTTVTSKIGNKPITITTNEKVDIKDVPITKSKTPIETAKTGPTSKPIGNSSISTTGKSGKTDSTNTPVVTVKPTVTTGKGGKIGPTIKPGVGGKGDKTIIPNILLDLNNVYTAQDLAKYNVPNEFITQFFDKVGNRFVLKEGVTFEQFEVSVQMYGTVVGNNDLATKLQDEATFNAIIDKLLASNKPFNLDSLVDAVVSELNLTNLSPVDVIVLTTMLTSLVSAYTGKTDDTDIENFLETNDKTFAQIYDEAVEANNSSKPGNGPKRVGPKNGETAQHYGEYLAMQGFATALGCMGGAAGIAGSLLSTSVDVCRLVDLYHWGQMGKDEFIMSLAETLMLGAMDLMVSTLPGGKAASKLAKPLLEKIVSKAVDKLIQSAIFDGVNDSFLGNNDTTGGTENEIDEDPEIPENNNDEPYGPHDPGAPNIPDYPNYPEPTDPVEPTEPTGPVEPTEPTNPANPPESTDNTEPSINVLDFVPVGEPTHLANTYNFDGKEYKYGPETDIQTYNDNNGNVMVVVTTRDSQTNEITSREVTIRTKDGDIIKVDTKDNTFKDSDGKTGHIGPNGELIYDNPVGNESNTEPSENNSKDDNESFKFEFDVGDYTNEDGSIDTDRLIDDYVNAGGSVVHFEGNDAQSAFAALQNGATIEDILNGDYEQIDDNDNSDDGHHYDPWDDDPLDLDGDGCVSFDEMMSDFGSSEWWDRQEEHDEWEADTEPDWDDYGDDYDPFDS